jgi:HK97 gp10 family phage protein
MPKKVIVTGVRGIDRQLRELPLRMQKQVVRRSLKEAGKIVKDAAKRNIKQLPAPLRDERTGQTARQMFTAPIKRSTLRVGVVISSQARLTRWGQFGGGQIELGTKHVTARPFLRPAGYDNEKQIRTLVIRDIKQTLKIISKYKQVNSKQLTVLLRERRGQFG